MQKDQKPLGQKQAAAPAYFHSKQLLLFVFAWHTSRAAL